MRHMSHHMSHCPPVDWDEDAQQEKKEVPWHEKARQWREQIGRFRISVVATGQIEDSIQ